jgi:signal transduction histidine kinase
VVRRTTGMGFAAVARVTEERWIACGVKDDIGFGLQPGGELKVKTTLCNEVRQKRDPVIINHVAEDEVYCGHPTPAMYGFQSYISMPIILPDGRFFGTLCAIDPQPAKLKTPEVVGMFKLFAELIAFHIDALSRLATSEANLAEEYRNSELREQFIAVLGHDLRNPLAAIDGGARFLSQTPMDEKAREFVAVIKGSIFRMAGLINNIMDFARGRLGGGLTLDRNARTPLGPILDQVAAESRAIAPQRKIETEFSLKGPVDCDQTRIAQLFSNLLSNALTHGAMDAPIWARASTHDGSLEISVANSGPPISAQAMERLFQPFFRADVRQSQQGLGLGLFIASEIARAHNGSLTVTSSADETRFTFRMPLR